MTEPVLTPWEVRGKIDYDKLIKEFGTSPISKQLLSRLSQKSELPALLRRGLYFSHRDLNLVLDDYDKGKGFFLYTGRAPSGPMHIGHLLSFEITKWFQQAFGANVYIQIPDEEKFLAKRDLTMEETDRWREDNLLEIAAMGFDPDKTFMFCNRAYSGKLFEPACRIAKKVTFSTAKAVFGFTNESNIGWIFYPAMQIVPTFFEKRRCLIPSAIDQDPYWRIQRDIAESFGYFKTSAIHSKFFPPLEGAEGKMSSSEAKSAILLSDSESEVKNKINKYAFSGGRPTIEEHRKLGADLSIDVPYQWLYYFFEPDDGKMNEITRAYSSGEMLTGEIKKILIGRINSYLSSHQKSKAKAKKALSEITETGSLARKMADWKMK